MESQANVSEEATFPQEAVPRREPVRFAIVAVFTSLARVRTRQMDDPDETGPVEHYDRVFHYGVPQEMRDALRVGQLVWVPFGARELQGVVVAFDHASPVEETKDIVQIVDPEPVLSPERVELARWMSVYYMAPVAMVISGMLPPGVVQGIDTVISLADDATEESPDDAEAKCEASPVPNGMPEAALCEPPAANAAIEPDVSSAAQADEQEQGEDADVDGDGDAGDGAPPVPNTDAQRELLALLKAKGPQTLQQIRSAMARKNWRDVINQIVRHGWAKRSVRVSPPKVKPKRVPVVRLHPGLDALPKLTKRAPRQQQALDYIASLGAGAMEWRALYDMARQAEVSTGTIHALVARGILELDKRQVWRDPLAGQEFVPVTPPPLTTHQAAVWEAVRADLEEPAGKPFLLHGVTGSGKTEIYLRAVAHALAQGRGAIVLVPEIALTPQTVRRFGARFPSDLAVMHSHLSMGERYDQWRRIRMGDLRVVVGSRSAVFAPVRNLGLIVLDEEHEWSYKQDRTPRYHARTVATYLAEQVEATCILGSATPDLETAYRAERGEYTGLEMPRRIMGHRDVVRHQVTAMSRQARAEQAAAHYQPLAESPGGMALYTDLPPVQVVDLRAELRSGNTSIFGHALREAITVALAAGEQVILFLNRRGSATFVQCRDCGYVCECPRCEIPLTYHSDADDLICHHCNYRTFVPPQCPSCWSGRIRYFGIGTQKVEELTQEAFPQARIVRWDLDTTGGKLAHEQLLDRFIRGEADIMVGTQMIAKGLDLPRVTLVGVITADTMLNLPDFRSSERTFQLLTQVAGRAGRSVLGGKVIIQTYTPHHPAIQAARRHDYAEFYTREIAFRREWWYPPISQLIHLLYVHPNRQHAQVEVERMHRALTLKIARLGIPNVDLLGPAPAFFARLRGKSRWQIIVRGADPGILLRDMHLPLGWRVDVDPVSLL